MESRGPSSLGGLQVYMDEAFDSRAQALEHLRAAGYIQDSVRNNLFSAAGRPTLELKRTKNTWVKIEGHGWETLSGSISYLNNPFAPNAKITRVVRSYQYEREVAEFEKNGYGSELFPVLCFD